MTFVLATLVQAASCAHARNGKQRGWGEVDDEVSIRAVHRALDMGVTFLDTADVYGAGHSERILAKALDGRRDEVVIASKFGMIFDEKTKEESGRDASAEYIPARLRGQPA